MPITGHAHHDDMLYLGKEPPASWDYPALTPQGYADKKLYEFWRARDPIAVYGKKLESMGLVSARDVQRMKSEAEAMVETEARAVVAGAWPDPATVTSGVLGDDPVDRRRIEILDRDASDVRAAVPALDVEAAPPFDKKGMTFLDAVMHGVGDALAADPRVFVFGQDV